MLGNKIYYCTFIDVYKKFYELRGEDLVCYSGKLISLIFNHD